MEGQCPEVIGESEDAGRVGSQATLTIPAGAFPMSGGYDVLWSKTAITEETECTVVASGELAPGTTTDVVVTFTIPEACFGTNYVQFRRSHRPEDPYGFIFKVLPKLELTPKSVSPGAKATIKGTGFPDEEEVELSFDGEDTGLEGVTANSVGTFTARFTVPDAMAGKHEFKAAAEGMFGTDDPTASLQVVPAISLAPKLPEIGSEATVSGRGFAASSPITVEYDEQAVVDSPQTDELGNFTETFTVPETAESEHVITVTDGAGNRLTLNLSLEGNPPPAPATVSPQAERFGWFGSQVVAFTWTDVDDPSGITYTLEIANNLNFFPLAPGMRKTELAQTSCLVNLEPGTYYWRVRAVDGAGNDSQWTLSPYSFRVGFFSMWYLLVGGFVFLLVFLFIIRAFFRRISEYYK